MSNLTKTLQVFSITTSLLASGGIATLSLFDVPLLQSQPASRSLPMTRWLFSRGSHIFPTAALLSSSGFAFLAFTALSPATRAQSLATALKQLIRLSSNGFQANAYLAAAVLSFSIAPWTTGVMIPTNFRLIELNEKSGGARSKKAAEAEGQDDRKVRSAEESVDGKNMPSQWTDLSGPQERTTRDPTAAEETEVRELLGKFAILNGVRAVLMAAGGVAGILAAVA